MQDYQSINRQHFLNYFVKGCKPKAQQMMLGLELEHFIINKITKESIGYYKEQGIETILNAIQSSFEQKTFSQEHLIGLSNSYYSLTLEPAAQLEISISPQTDIKKIEQIYESFLTLIQPVLDQFGYEFAYVGYQPKSKAKELPLIPKKRYEFMDHYFESLGDYGTYMMRGTASTQVSIDYISEEDFKEKYKVAYYLTPFFTFLCDNTPVFEGTINTKPMNRFTIWNHVDKKRVSVSPYMNQGVMSFEDYINFLYQAPVIVKKDGENDVFTDLTIGELAKEKEFSMEEIEHYLSMVFPAVRLKRYIEIRMADSMPIYSVKVYLAFIKGIFTNINVAKNLIHLLSNETNGEVDQIVEALSNGGIHASIGSVTVKDIMKQLFEIAYDGLSDDEKDLLLSMRQNILKKGTILGEHL